MEENKKRSGERNATKAVKTKAVKARVRQYFEHLRAELEQDSESFFQHVMRQAERPVRHGPR
jgi:hypothetical protein